MRKAPTVARGKGTCASTPRSVTDGQLTYMVDFVKIGLGIAACGGVEGVADVAETSDATAISAIANELHRAEEVQHRFYRKES